jgi:hypothetical protein
MKNFLKMKVRSPDLAVYTAKPGKGLAVQGAGNPTGYAQF